MKPLLAQRRDWLVATSAMQRLQLTVAVRRLGSHVENADAALRPWIAIVVVTLQLITALRARRGKWRTALVWGMVCWRTIAAIRRRR
jgi:hypothetical protein